MKVRYAILLLFLSFSFLLKSQYSINGTFIGLPSEKVMLVQTNGSKHTILDSTQLNDNGSFKFVLPGNLSIGQYQVFTKSGVAIDLLYNKENIQFVALHDGYDQLVQIIESNENRVFYDFVNLKEKNLMKLDILSPVIKYYPPEDEFYQLSVNKVLKLREEINDRAKDLIGSSSNSLASHFIKISLPVFADIGLQKEMQKEYLKSHFLDHVDFNDTILLNSNLLNSKIINYLSLYQDQDVSKETFEFNLLSGVDSILKKAAVNQSMYTYVVGFLIGGFEAVGFEKGLEYIAQHNQLDELCVNSERLLALQNKIELINKLAIGKIAPNFNYVDLNGDMIDLDKIDAPKVLLFFWASWCPHCKDMITIINEIEQSSDQNIQVIGFSIDSSLVELDKIISEYDIKWPIIAELKGWEGEIINQYGIVATPSIFILDQDKKIVAKPTNKSELKNLLDKL